MPFTPRIIFVTRMEWQFGAVLDSQCCRVYR
jgi:hypothetical protein